MNTYTYKQTTIAATPRNKRLTDGIQKAASTGGGGGGTAVEQGEQYWKLVTEDTDGNALSQPYIITTYPAVSEKELTAWGLGSASLSDITLSNLGDVDVSSLSDGQVLVWDATTEMWIASDYSGGGGSSVVYDGTQNGLVPYVSGKNTSSYYLNGTGSWSIPPDTNTTYSTFGTYSSGLVPFPGSSYATSSYYLNGAGSWSIPPDTNTTYNTFSQGYSGLVPATSTSTAKNYYFLNGSGSWSVPSSTNYDVFDQYTDGLVPSPGSYCNSQYYLNGTGAWTIPPDTNTTYSGDDMRTAIGVFDSSTNGLVPAPGESNTAKYLNSSGSFSYVSYIKTSFGDIYEVFDSGNPSKFGWIPAVTGYGVTELGRYIDMHYSLSGTRVDYDYRIELISTSVLKFGGNIYSTGEMTAYTSSDERLKKDITPITNGLNKVLMLDPVNFFWNMKAVELNAIKDTRTMQAGFIAQDLQKILPESVHQSGDYLSIDREYILPYLVAAVQELYYMIRKGGDR